MKVKKLYIALTLLIIFPLVRTLWFYNGIYFRPHKIETPDFTNMEIETPEIKTAEPEPISTNNQHHVVVFDTDHDNLFLMSDIEVLTDTLAEMGVQVEINNSEHSLKDQLKYASAYVVIAPDLAFSNDEIESIIKFVERGGQMLVINDPTRSIYEAYGTTAYLMGIDITNLLLAPFGIAFQNDYVYNLIENEGNFRNIFLENFSHDQPLTRNVSQIVFYGAHSLKTSQTVLARGDESTLSSLDDQGGDIPLAALAGKGNGSVLVLGDINFLEKSYYQVADNHQFILNIAAFLTSAKRQQVLDDIPYLFERPVTILTDANASIDNELLETLTSTQNYLDSLNLSLEISEEPINGNDLLILGTFPPDEELEDYLSPFDIEFNINNNSFQNDNSDFSFFFDDEYNIDSTEATATIEPENEVLAEEDDATPEPEEDHDIYDDEEEDSIYVSGLGKFAAKGIGLVLFTPTDERNTLILLTASTRSLGDFTYNILNYGDLSSCLTKQNVAVCSIDSSYADYEDYDDSEDEDESDDEDSDFDFFDDTELDEDY